MTLDREFARKIAWTVAGAVAVITLIVQTVAAYWS